MKTVADAIDAIASYDSPPPHFVLANLSHKHPLKRKGRGPASTLFSASRLDPPGRGGGSKHFLVVVTVKKFKGAPALYILGGVLGVMNGILLRSEPNPLPLG